MSRVDTVENNYVIGVLSAHLAFANPAESGSSPSFAQEWGQLLAQQAHATPFMRFEYLAAMELSGSAVPATGWQASVLHVRSAGRLVAACVVYVKSHSYGEYVFDQAWANAHHQHGLPYYPKAVVAPPFTPVPGTRLLAVGDGARDALIQALVAWCTAHHLSSLHLLFVSAEDEAACVRCGLMLRSTVQFHWKNVAPTLAASQAALPPEGAQFALGRPGGESLAPTLAASQTALPPEGAQFALRRPGGESLAPTLAASQAALPPAGASTYRSFEAFLSTLSQDKRKKIRQERRKVAESGVTWQVRQGSSIESNDWAFFYRCYAQTYREHGNAPYLTPAFFEAMRSVMPEDWLLFTAIADGAPIATSLIAINAHGYWTKCQNDGFSAEKIAYGRYWGALARVDCLHFEACYYQPLEWCIANGYDRFEGGAQGEHKMARGLLPIKAQSAHWLAHPAFADAIERHLRRETGGIADYMSELEAHTPFKTQT